MLNLKGHSRFTTKLVSYQGKLAVMKSAPTAELYRRLEEQVLRQASSVAIYSEFKSPEVLVVDEQSKSVTMEYLPYPSPIHFLRTASLGERQWFYGEVIKYFDHLIDKSAVTLFDQKIFEAKIRSTFSNIALQRVEEPETLSCIRDVCKKFVGRVKEMTDEYDYIVPVHGDFTLSNLLVDPGGKIYWLDFMDGWNHSVMVDFAKIYQEIRYGWSCRFQNEATVKYWDYHALMEEMALWLDRKFFRSDKDGKVFRAYCLLNDLRLLQYEKDPVYTDWIIRKIEEMVTCI